MDKNILQPLERFAINQPQKPIFIEEKAEISYEEFVRKTKSIGSKLVAEGFEKSNVAIFIGKTINCLLGMFGAMYSNSCYAVIDTVNPIDRIETIIKTFEPECIITDEKNIKKAEKYFGGRIKILLLEEITKTEIEDEALSLVRKKQIDTDPLYVLFTSGSTGVPKGTVINHRSVIDYANTICNTFDINQNTRWGNQAPFYFSACILDLYTTIVGGGTFVIIPKKYFSFPGMLIEYLNEHKVNSLYWVPTALNMVADFDTFSEIMPTSLEKVMFVGEVMPIKQLNYWMDALPNLLYVNLYGPTEITDTCTYYVVNRRYELTESLPIGKQLDNCEVLIINDENKLVSSPDDGEGELYVRGSFVGMGYYNNPEKTADVFVQNPLNNHYPEILYRTGDIVCYNDDMDIVFKGRKDHQIKHLGHRIELGEIETAAASVDGVMRTCCVYDYDKKEIVMFYTGSIVEEDISKKVRSLVTNYMMPGRIVKLDALPINMNDKIDRVKLKEEYL